MAEFMPVLNSPTMAAITISPTAIEIMSSRSVKPRSDFCFGIFILFIWPLAEGRNQCVNAVAMRNSRSARKVTDRNGDLLEIGINRDSVGLKDGPDLNLAGEVGQAHRLVIGRPQNAVS